MRKDSHRSARSNPGGRVRYAVVGLGYIAQVAVLPAFVNARRNSEICALFSGDPAKRRTLGRKYGVEHLYGYEDYERGLDESGADAVYIALPNNLHREYTERAAAMGVHVLCEKPMAPSGTSASTASTPPGAFSRTSRRRSLPGPPTAATAASGRSKR